MGRPIPAPFSTRMPTILQSQVSTKNCAEESLSRSYGESVKESLQKLRHYSFIVTDPHLPGHPIVYASEGFLHMTGYLAEEVMGRNPRFMQGPDTDRRALLQIRDAVREEKPCRVALLNYTKQGWPFRVVFHMAPVFSEANGQLLHFVGAQNPLADCLSKKAWHCEASLLGLHKGPAALLGPKSYNRINSCLKGNQLSDSSLNHHNNWQKKKKMKIASTILQLVVHELVTSNKLMSDKALRGGCLSEKAETALSSSLTLALTRIQQSFVISDAKLPGMPIVYASDMFLHLTGYQRHEVIGRTCKFLHGQDTDACAVEQIRDAIRQDKACTVRVLNYRKSGSPFWNLLHVAPVRDHTAKVVYYVGVQLHLGFPLDEGTLARRDATPAMWQLGAVGAVKVAVRSLQSHGLRRSSS